MKKFYLFLILSACLYVNEAWAQTQNRNIYIWDVTRSMIGQGTVGGKKTPDVYDKVVKYMKDDIQMITDSSTEIVIIPFQETSLLNYVIFSSNATEESKSEIYKKIDEYGDKCLKLPHEKTNISGPLLYAQGKYQKQDRCNKLILLTDGKQNTNGGKEELDRAVMSWDKEASDYDLLVYIRTTKNADEIPNGEHISQLNDDEFEEGIEILELKPSSPLFNIKDDSQIVISFTLNSDHNLPSNIQIHVESVGGSPIAIREDVALENGVVKIAPKYNYEQLRENLSEESYMRLNLSVTNNEDLKNQRRKIVFSPAYSSVKLINKKERVLTISLVE